MSRRMNCLTALSLIIIAMSTILSCADHTLPAADEFSCSSLGVVSFTTDIKPIIDTKCAIAGDGGCHNGGNGPALDWRVFDNLQSYAASVKTRVTRPVGTSGHMPKIGSLTDDQIRQLVCWVDQGAPAN